MVQVSCTFKVSPSVGGTNRDARDASINLHSSGGEERVDFNGTTHVVEGAIGSLEERRALGLGALQEARAETGWVAEPSYAVLTVYSHDQ